MTQSIAESFIEQLEQAAAGGDVNLYAGRPTCTGAFG